MPTPFLQRFQVFEPVNQRHESLWKFCADFENIFRLAKNYLFNDNMTDIVFI